MWNRIPTACAVLLVLSVSWFSSVQTASAQGGAWATNGPEGAIVNAIAVDPLTPRTVYAGTEGAGVFKSIDAGGTWTPANNGLPGLLIYAVAVDPQASTTLYATVSRSGVFKSVDGGDTWTDASAGIPPSIRSSVFCLAIDPQTPTTLYAGTNDGGVFKTIDGAGTWSHSPGVSPLTVASLAIDPQVPDTIYAGTDLNLWKSMDGGDTWIRTGFDRASVFSLAIDPITSSTIYARIRSFSPQPGLNGVYKSTDGGATWTFIVPNGRALAIDPETPNTIYASAFDSGVFRSTDGGASWTELNDGLTNLSVASLAIDPAAGTLYAGTEGGGVFARDLTLRFTLTVAKSGIGSGTVTSSPGGIDCGADCSEPFVIGTTATLTAMPAFGSIFMGWDGCDSTSGSTCTLTVSAARSVTASFIGLPVTLGLPAGGTGSVAGRR